MRIVGTLAAAALILAARYLPAAAQATSSADTCAPVNGLSFVCGVNKPEDLAPVPGTRWLVTSGLVSGGGIRIVDTEAKTARLFYTGSPQQLNPNKALFPDCPTPPNAAIFNVHGISLHSTRLGGVYTLYAVSHGALESIEVFTLDARTAQPTLAWTGCVPMPAGYKGNSVTSYSDGTILANVEIRPGTTMADVLNGRSTGGVWEWKPGEAAFQLLPGTELSGNNGIEVAADESGFYVATSGTQTVVAFARADTAKPLWTVKTPGFNPDNLRWSDGRLIAAGMMFDEPACGGTRKQILDRGGNMGCHRGYIAAQLDPATMTWKILAYGEPNPAFGGIATAVVMGKSLWLSSYQADRVAYRPLPGAQ